MSSLTLAAVGVFEREVPESIQAPVAPLPTHVRLAVALPRDGALLLVCLAVADSVIDSPFRLTIAGWGNIQNYRMA